MSLEQINIGTFANDGTGDDLREAFNKVNLNFQDLDLRDDESTTATNIGTIGEGIFAKKNNFELQFKKIVGGFDTTLTAAEDKITIDVDTGLKRIVVVSDSGSKILETTDNINLYGSGSISTRLVGSTLTITSAFNELSEDTSPVLGASLDAAGFAIANATNVSATTLTGTINGNVVDNSQNILVNYQTGKIVGPIDNQVVNTAALEFNSQNANGFKVTLAQGNYSADRTITLPNANGELALRSDIPAVVENEWNFGFLGDTIASVQEWLYGDPDVDMGTFGDPETRTIDLGDLIV
jgi:hypothetical protein